MVIKTDEDSMSRMLGIPAAQIPEKVLAEYELRLKLFHCDGNSGPLGTIGIIDMIRSMGLKPASTQKQTTLVDWSRVPMNGSVRVMARLTDAQGKPTWVSGVYVGQVGVGSLAVRLDGDLYVHEMHRADVRIAREEPMEPESVPGKKLTEDVPSETGPWSSVKVGDPVMVEAGDDYQNGQFQGVQEGEVLVLLEGELTSRPFASELVTAIVAESITTQ